MNQLPGWPYPAHIGGAVGEPAFVMHCGDMVDGQENAELELRYYDYFRSRLRYRQYEVLGNHDGNAPMLDCFIRRYGARSHSFDVQGMHFVSLATSYQGSQPGMVARDDMLFLERDLAEVADECPVVLFVHSRLDRLQNGDEVLLLLRDSRVILIASAHIHKPAVFDLEGIPCVDIGQCRNHPIDPEYGRNFEVVHIHDNQIQALPWRWDLEDWERGQRWADPLATSARFTLQTTF